MDRTMERVLAWAPRILGIGFTLFLAVFALDAFDGNGGVGVRLLDFSMHLLPAFVLAAVVAVAWRRERWGGALYVGLALLYPVLMWGRIRHWSWVAVISGVPMLIALLLLAHVWFVTRERRSLDGPLSPV